MSAETDVVMTPWQRLKEQCTSTRALLSDCLTDNYGVQADQYLSVDLIKKGLCETSQRIDNKIEEILILAFERTTAVINGSGSNNDTERLNEFIDQLCLEVHEIGWLLVRMPINCGDHLWRGYSQRTEKLLEIVEGVERIYWAIKNGYGQVPRKRDFNTLHLFKGLPESANEDAQRRWDIHLEQLKDACGELKNLLSESFGNSEDEEDEDEEDDGFKIGDLSEEERDFILKIMPICKLVTTVFKKIRLRCLSIEYRLIRSHQPTAEINKEPISKSTKSNRHNLIDEILTASEPIIPIADDLVSTLSFPPYSYIWACERVSALVRATQGLIEVGKDWCGEEEHLAWFDNCTRQLDEFLLAVTEMNPSR